VNMTTGPSHFPFTLNDSNAMVAAGPLNREGVSEGGNRIT